ncbi:alpha/beta hydrolase [Oceanicella actignis]|uniref:Palmitoyl-protein thioesterase ABHD10, mitochondrial n=1 Tax=Oceanicella actignis TaxID=1189325 RepID=A0A1M7TNJ5_9RHOB|nr:alpha/beta hydrolase [Oceanicella actignis]SET72743.1 Pimeloyl-ACP methyl ester carboxylesterase [Oceanicella actignis]SHN72307.1 Pimeloyl-ACP methyl ester carboxylesterase [Oceanicella actignis]
MTDAEDRPDFLETADGRRIAYRRTPDAGAGAPGVVFLGGFRSDMTGTKAAFLEERCRARGRAFLRFDYTGHGQSSGRFEDGCIGDWLRDARDAIAALTEGPQVLVGSSMGGWIALLLAREAPERVAALIGIAAAPDFTLDGMEAAFDEAQRQEMARTGRVALPSEYSDEPYVITRRLIEDGRDHLVLRAPLPLPFPTRLLQGSADVDVPPERARILFDHAKGPDIRLLLVKGADHRFSGPRELRILDETLEEAIAAAREAGR